MVGHLGDDDLRLAQELDGTHGEQSGVAGTTPDERDPLRGPRSGVGQECWTCSGWSQSPSCFFGFCADQFRRTFGQHLCRNLLPQADGVVEGTGGGPSYRQGAVGGQRHCSDPQFVTEVPFRNFGQGAHRCRAPRFELREQRSLGRDAGPGAPGRRAPGARVPAARRRPGTPRRERPGPGAGSICSGSSTSVASSARPSRARPARASTTASSSPEATLPSRVSTLPRTPTTLHAEAEGLDLGHPAWRAGADPGAGRQLAEGEAVAGHHDVARVLPRGHGGERDAVGRERWAGP